MAQVPYSPVPDVVPTAPAAPRVGVSTPPQAFGITTAEAEQRLGGQAEQSSNELASTALAFQGLKNETWAKNEFVNQSAKLGQIESDFYGLKGQAAVAAAPKYASDVRSLYEDAIQNAPNPQAARFLGDALSRRISYSLVDGQRHAGQQQLAAAGDASIANVAMGIDEISKRPQDDDFFNSKIESFEREARVQEGLGNGKAEANLLKWKRLAWEARFDTLVFDNPDAAQALLDQHRDEIPPDARKNIQAQIKNGLYTIRATQSFATAQSRQEAEQTVGQIAARNVGTNPDTGDVTINPRLYKELTDYSRANPAAEKDAQERITWAQRQQDRQAKGEVVRTDPNTLSALTGNMFESSRPTRERDVLIAETNGQLSHKDGTWLRTIIKERDGGDKTALTDPLFKTASDWAKNSIEGTSAADRAMNAGNYAAFQFKFLQTYLKAVQENKLEPSDLNVGNPDSMVRKIAEEFMPGIGQTIRNNGGAAPSPPRPAPPTATPTPVTINSKAEYDALKPGTPFKFNGKGYLKPEGSSPPQAAM